MTAPSDERPAWLDDYAAAAKRYEDAVARFEAASPPPAAPSLREALEGLLACFDGMDDADVSALGMKRASRAVVVARAALASPEPAPRHRDGSECTTRNCFRDHGPAVTEGLLERAIAAACPDPAAHDEAAVTEGLDVERLTYKQVVAALDAARYEDHPGGSGIHVGRLTEELNARLSAEQPDTE